MTHSAADPPTRSTNSLTLGLGAFVQIRCELFSSLEKATVVGRSQFTEDGHPIGHMNYDKETVRPYGGPVVKKATASDGTLVELTDDEIEQFLTGEKGQATIEYLIPLSALYDGTYVVDGLCQLRPAMARLGSGAKAKKVPDLHANKAFAMLCAEMGERGVAALVRIVRKTTRYAALLPSGRMVILAFAEQVRADRPMPADVATEAERAMASALIDTLPCDTPVLTDTASFDVQAYIDAKAEGQAPALTVVEDAPSAPDDLLAALQASVAAARKAAA